MVDRSIRVDERTDALVTDLAYFLRSSKKSILQDAVAEFAETHHPRFVGGPGSVRTVGATDGELAVAASPSGEGEYGSNVVGGPAGGGLAGSGADAGSGGYAGSGGHAGAGAGGVTFEMLDPLDRLALRRRELLRRFAEHGGANVRVLDPPDEDAASGESASTSASGIVLLAETDPVDGSAAVPALEEVARRVLGLHVTVVSLTALRMFGSGRIDQALAESRPL
jgi:hypothetical protein